MELLFRALRSNSFKLYISPYKLKRRLFSQEGVLLAFEFKGGLRGYSDFLPWPSFGENSLPQQLKQIKRGEFSQRFLIAMRSALLDAKARSQQRNLFFGLKIPDSHFLIPDLLNFKNPDFIFKKNFKKIKVKLKPYKINQQISALKALSQSFKDVRWRLDFNGMSWLFWKNKLEFLKPYIDFIEDPQLEKNSFNPKEKLLFAGDWESSPYFQIRIIKPSRDSLNLLIKQLALFRWKRVVFTHSFEHPLGQAITAFWAGLFYKYYPHFFETGAFVSGAGCGQATSTPRLLASAEEERTYRLEQEGPFKPPQGFGFGFGHSLKKEKWKRWL